MTYNDRKFISFVKQQCSEHGIKCELRDVTYLRAEAKQTSAGYFNEIDGILACSMKNKGRMHTLVHEYAHMTQWLDEEPLFMNVTPSLIKVNDWLEGKDIRNIEEHMANVRDMELDNEKRSVKLIKKHELSIDIPEYIRKANAYIHFHNYMMYSRKWFSDPDMGPSMNKRMVAAMSSKFNMKYTSMSKKLFKIYQEENI